MSFFEEELRKLLKGIENKIVYVGNTAYIFCGDEKRIKVSFHNGYCADTYDGIVLTALDKKTAELDKNFLNFSRVFANKEYGYRIERDMKNWIWRSQPTERQYLLMTSEIAKYISVFE